MGKIVAIGGGELGDLETLNIDKEIVRLTGKKIPRALFIPTASNDAGGYYEDFDKVYGRKLNCTTDVLYLVDTKFSYASLREKILSSDLIYVGGGNTLNMLKVWKQNRVDQLLKEAYKKDIVLSGLSAGAICWFKYGSSDSRKSSNPKTPFVRISGLNLIPALASPHHIREPHRRDGIIELMKKTSGVGIALDDNSALEIVDEKYRIITSQLGAKAHKVYHHRGHLHYSEILQTREFKALDVLLKR